jgi:hypothetical protein
MLDKGKAILRFQQPAFKRARAHHLKIAFGHWASLVQPVRPSPVPRRGRIQIIVHIALFGGLYVKSHVIDTDRRRWLPSSSKCLKMADWMEDCAQRVV